MSSSSTETHWARLVKVIRRHEGWSQEELALRLGVNQASVSRWERGRDTPSLRIRRALRDLARRHAEDRQDRAVRLRIRNSLWPSTLLCEGAIFLEVSAAAAVEAGLGSTELRGRRIYGLFGPETDDVTDRWERMGIFNGDLALSMSVNRLRAANESDQISYIRTMDTPHFTGDGRIWCLSQVQRITEADYLRLRDEFGGPTFVMPFDTV